MTRLQVVQSLRDNLNLLNNDRKTDHQSAALYNISNALIGLYEDLAVDMENLNARLNEIEAHLSH
jgi:hypothetical protein